MNRNVLLTTNMVLLVPMVALVVQAVLVVSTEQVVSVDLKISSQVFRRRRFFSQSERSSQGDDLQYRVNLTFEEAIFGAEKEVKYNREASCSTCNGSGAKPGTSPVTCGRCHGAGVINVDTQTPLGMMRRQVTCDVCHGRGKEIKDPCNHLSRNRS